MIHPEDYYKLVFTIAKGYAKRANAWHHIEDMVQAGMVAVVDAVQGGTFDESKGFKFSTYLRNPVCWAIERYLCSSLYAITVQPGQNGETRSAIAKGMFGKVCFSLNRKIGDKDDESYEWEDMLEDHNPSAHDMIESEELKLFVESLIALQKKWNPLHMDILRNRLMEPDKKSASTLQEIGDRAGVCRERVRQIENKMKAELRHGLMPVAEDYLTEITRRVR